jgi:hypothetical protein
MNRSIVAAISLVSVLMCGSASSSKAQSGQIDRAQMSRDQVGAAPGPTVTTTSVDDSHVVTSPNDADLGEQQILKRNDTYQPFVVSVAVPFYWTSNVALTNRGEQDDFLISPVVAIAYQPRLAKNLYAYVSLREQQFFYTDHSAFNFGSFDAEVGLTYTVPEIYNLALHAGYDYNRLTEKNSFNDFFQNHVLLLGADIPVRISRAQQLSFGVDANISMDATPQGPRRHDFDGWVGYSMQVTRALNLSATGRIVLHEYVVADRRDVTEMVTLNANYAISQWFSANAMASYAANQSNHSVFDYEVGDIGGAVSFSIRF